jgi:hypothetical protein
MDEVGFGPSGETRVPSRRLRALAASVCLAGVAAAGVAHALTARNAHHALTSQPPVTQSAVALLPDPARVLPPAAGCAPTKTNWPSLAALPAGMRPGAMPVLVDAQFSGRCPVP